MTLTGGKVTPNTPPNALHGPSHGEAQLAARFTSTVFDLHNVLYRYSAAAVVAYSTNSTPSSMRPARERTGLVVSSDADKLEVKNHLPVVGDRSYTMMLRTRMFQSSAAQIRFPLGSGAIAHGDCAKFCAAESPGRSPIGTNVVALITCSPTFDEEGVDPMEASICGYPRGLYSVVSECSAFVAAALYVTLVAAVEVSVARVASPNVPMVEAQQEPVRVKLDCPVRDATDRNDELSEAAPSNAVNADVVVTAPVPSTRAITFVAAALAPPFPGAVFGGAL